ncbi:MAG: hypothetical protein ACI8Z5_000240, partial [Lentimonas sp.]
LPLREFHRIGHEASFLFIFYIARVPPLAKVFLF